MRTSFFKSIAVHEDFSFGQADLVYRKTPKRAYALMIYKYSCMNSQF